MNSPRLFVIATIFVFCTRLMAYHPPPDGLKFGPVPFGLNPIHANSIGENPGGKEARALEVPIEGQAESKTLASFHEFLFESTAGVLVLCLLFFLVVGGTLFILHGQYDRQLGWNATEKMIRHHPFLGRVYCIPDLLLENGLFVKLLSVVGFFVMLPFSSLAFLLWTWKTKRPRDFDWSV